MCVGAIPQPATGQTPPFCLLSSHHNQRSCPASAPPQEHNPSALARLLRTTEATKSRFLDRKFLRRQQKAAGASARGSRFWYLDLDTWQASTTGAAVPSGGAAGVGNAAAAGAGRRSAQQAAAAAAAEQQNHSVPVDDSQVSSGLCGRQARGAACLARSSAAAGTLPHLTHRCPADRMLPHPAPPRSLPMPLPCLQTHCALSGEAFEQFWDEAHQEWRYRGARALGAEEAARWAGAGDGACSGVWNRSQGACGLRPRSM